MNDRSKVPYIGPIYPLTLDNYERLSPEQYDLFWWVSTFVAQSNDELSMILLAAGVDNPVHAEMMRALGL